MPFISDRIIQDDIRSNPPCEDTNLFQEDIYFDIQLWERVIVILHHFPIFKWSKQYYDVYLRKIDLWLLLSSDSWSPVVCKLRSKAPVGGVIRGVQILDFSVILL